MRYVYPFLIAAFAALPLACADHAAPVVDKPDAPAVLPLPDTGQPLTQYPAERVSLPDGQWDARSIPAGTTRIDLEASEIAGQLRFALLPAMNAQISATLYQGDSGIPLAPARDALAWTWRTQALNGQVPVRLVLESAAPFHLAACKVVPDVPDKPDVLVYLIDTLRMDQLGCYHYPLDTSPQIDVFARDATTFRNLVPMSSWTRPSVASLLTGTMDYTHHAISSDDHLRKGLPSLAASLADAGWETHAFVCNPAVSASYGFFADMHTHLDLGGAPNSKAAEDDALAVDRALATIAAAQGQPLFLYVHTMAPHRNYEPGPAYADLFMPDRFVGSREQVRLAKELALYNAEIRFSDDQFARIIQALKAAGRYDNALIVLVSDHGEQFMEHGERAHAKSLHFSELGVPLLVKLPGNTGAGNTVRHVVQMADVAPSILSALGLPVPPAMEGRSFLPLISLQGSYPPLPGFARLRTHGRHFYAARTPTLKFIHDVTLDESTWFDLEADPLEVRPLRKPPPEGEALKAFADAIAAKPIPEAGSTSPPLSPQQREQLDALGYL
jgi:arylsulfatase A-like enzyme